MVVPRSRRILLPVVLLLGGALAACGSTVQTDRTTAQAGSLSQPVAVAPDGTALDGSVAPGSTPGGVDVPGGTGAVPDAAGVPAVDAPGGTAPDPADPNSTIPGPGDDPLAGTSDELIQVGISYTINGEAANAALGAAIKSGDSKANMQALVDDLNERGGIAGRKIQPVFFAYDPQSSNTPSNQDQAACSQYTEDNDVAIVLGGGLTETLDACLQRAGVLQIASGAIINPDKALLAKYPSRIQLGTMTQDRMMADQVDTLKRLDYFSGWDFRTGMPASGAPRIGVLSLDLPQWDRPLKNVLLPRLASAGFRVDPSNVYAVRSASTTGELTATAADVQNATLRFASAGVTHVIILDASGTVSLLFGQASSQQLYYPRWGINSGTGVQALYDTGVFSTQTLNGAVGLGWLPNLDLPRSTGVDYQTAAGRSCLALLTKRTGQTYPDSNSEGIAYSDCDSARLMELALKGAVGQLSLATVIASIEAIGSSFKPALVPTSFLGAGRHDSVQSGFDMRWNSTCRCIEYLDKHTVS